MGLPVACESASASCRSFRVASALAEPLSMSNMQGEDDMVDQDGSRLAVSGRLIIQPAMAINNTARPILILTSGCVVNQTIR